MNNEYCILLSKLLLPLLHKAADLIYTAGSSLPTKLNSYHFSVSGHVAEKANNMQLTVAAEKRKAYQMFNVCIFKMLTFLY